MLDWPGVGVVMLGRCTAERSTDGRSIEGRCDVLGCENEGRCAVLGCENEGRCDVLGCETDGRWLNCTEDPPRLGPRLIDGDVEREGARMAPLEGARMLPPEGLLNDCPPPPREGPPPDLPPALLEPRPRPSPRP